MTVSKELIQDLNIVSMNLSFFDFEDYKKTGDNANFDLIPCILTKYDDGKFVFSFLQNSKIDITNVALQAVIKESEGCFIQETSLLKILEAGTDYVIANIPSPSQTIEKLLELLLVLSKREEKYGRRKEPRIKIGKENFRKFGLSSAEQKVFSKSAKVIQPCAILDISVHGICLITPFENTSFKNLDNFHIHLSFINPEQTVILQCHKVHSKLNDTGNRVLATLSCQLLEPIHYVWKERVLKLLENEDMEYTSDCSD